VWVLLLAGEAPSKPKYLPASAHQPDETVASLLPGMRSPRPFAFVLPALQAPGVWEVLGGPVNLLLRRQRHSSSSGVILIVGIGVALLGAPPLIAGTKHGYALGEHNVEARSAADLRRRLPARVAVPPAAPPLG